MPALTKYVSNTAHSLLQITGQAKSPKMMGFSASKNTPQRVTEITKIFHDAKLLLNHTISLQTMQGDVVKNVGRQNVKTEDYLKMQHYRNE